MKKLKQGNIIIDDVSVIFERDGVKNIAIDSTSIKIMPGEFVCILGPSGCGKSTLLNAVAGFISPTQGSVSVDGNIVEKPGPDRGMVFQQYSLFPWKTIRENVAFGPLQTGSGRAAAEGTANTFLSMVGLYDYADRYPAELSGGMKQRVGIARALANYPSVLLMDEPFGALDAQTRVMMQENLLQIWSEFRITVMFITHDIDEAIFLADRVLVMSASPGRIIADIDIELARPRTLEMTTKDEFIDSKKQCIEIIKAESMRAFEQQNPELSSKKR
ncbi:MAG: ABC transporter ATP-binding protein [Pseudomonadota bacterium]|nr:ABC transporter ATP-binding protein [Pseudomonadota bacterium]